MHTFDPEYLHSSFARAWHGVGAVLDAPSPLCHQLIGAYQQPHRKYHSVQHLVECLQYFDKVSHLAVRPSEIEIALWFHDAIYDLKRGDNEQQSADWARRELEIAKVPPEVIDRICRLILVTLHTGKPTEADENLLVDIDLSILGATPERFAEYEKQIREEYAFVPLLLFRVKRKGILQSFANRTRLYKTDYFYQLLENRARRNLQQAI